MPDTEPAQDAEYVAELEAENRRLRETLTTAWLLVAKDAADAPGRISTAVRPFLAAAIERLNDGVDDGS